MQMQAQRPWFVLIMFALAWPLLMAGPVSAAEDFAALEAAIAAANRGSDSSIALTADISLSAPLPKITGEVSIDGNGYRISGNDRQRIFDVSGGTLTIRDLTLAEGNAEAGGAIQLSNGALVRATAVTFVKNRAANGGAIAAHGANNRIVIERSSFVDNHAEISAGAIDVSRGRVTINNSSFVRNRSSDFGGVVVSQSAVIDVENSTFHLNRAASSGGVFSIYNTDLTLTHATMTNNSTAYGEGDAIHNHDGRVKLRNSIVANRAPASDCAGGLDQSAGNFSSDGTCGFTAPADLLLDAPTGSPAYLPPLDHSPVIDAADPDFCLESDQLGQARPYGGGCDIGAIETTTAAPAPTPLEPPPPCPLDLRIVAANTDAPAGGCPAGDGHDVISLFQDITLTSSLPIITSDITIEGNGHTISGAGKYRIFKVSAGKLTINNATLSEGFGGRLNSAGGAVALQGEGQLAANHVRFIDNVAAEGGAIGSRYDGVRFSVNSSRFEGNVASFTGGAISMNGGGRGTIASSSFVRNHADHEGGAIYTISGAVSVDNSTFTSNRARTRGGALSIENAAVTLTHVTMYYNLAPLGSGIYVSDRRRSDVRLRNSLLDRRVSAPVCSGRLAQNIGSLIADGTCSPMLSGDPLFAEPEDSAPVLRLQAGSPALNTAHPTFCPATDQLGNPRPQDGGCDIGAIEMPSGCGRH